MRIAPLPAFSDNYIWAINHEENNTFICVDPGDADPVIDYALQNGLLLEAILITHHHFDHIGGVNALMKRFPNVEVYGPYDPRIPFVHKTLNSQDKLTFDHCAFEIHETPGHTSTHIAYYEPNAHWLFCGDTLFSGGCGRVFDGTIEQLHESLLFFATLPDATKIYCAHEYTLQNLQFAQTVEPNNQEIKKQISKIKQNLSHCTLPSTLALEKKINPFLRVNQDSLCTFAKNMGVKNNDPLSIFQFIRALKNNYIAPIS